jgi:Zn-dependent protease with chaperone function
MGSGTRWAPLSDWLIAERINKAVGGALVGPWDVKDLPDDIIEIAFGIVDTYPTISKQRAAVEKHLENWRSSHPTYKKRVERLRKLRRG